MGNGGETGRSNADGRTILLPNKTTDAEVYRVGIYGWRKRCLYLLILMLTAVIVLNIALTIWIMKVMDFHLDGMGAVRVTDRGMRVDGEAEFASDVYLDKIESVDNHPLHIESDRNIQLNARLNNKQTTSTLFLGRNLVEAKCNKFQIFDSKENLLFYTDEHEVGVKAENLRIIGNGGSTFDGAVQTSMVKPEGDNPLRLEVPTRALVAEAGHDVEITSQAGDVRATALLNVNLESKTGAITLSAHNVYLRGLRASNARGQVQFQLCTCKNGRLFLARNGADCRATRFICKK